MFVVKVSGGLGNQMFQYAFGFAKSIKENEPFKLDVSHYRNDNLRRFNLIEAFPDLSFALLSDKELERLFPSSIFGKLKKRISFKQPKIFRESRFEFSRDALEANPSTYFDGYWQSWKYFDFCSKELKKEFIFDRNKSLCVTQFQNFMNSTVSASIHIRRGDYVNNFQINAVHGTCSVNYYQRAVNELEKIHPNITFFIFSDDIPWVKENFGFVTNKIFIEGCLYDWEEMYLISQCRFNIIANSSFSWWGAWLNEYPDKIVIAPEKWFSNSDKDTSDLIPPEWIRL